MSDWATVLSIWDECLLVFVCLFVCCFVKQRQKHFQVAEHLVESNLQSVDSHGVIRLTQYTDQVSKVRLAKIFPNIQVRKGLLVPDGRPSERR